MDEPNMGFCEMEMKRTADTFEKADQLRRRFDAHFSLAGLFPNRRDMALEAGDAPLNVAAIKTHTEELLPRIFFK